MKIPKSSKTNLFKTHQRVFRLTVPPKIILPEDRFVVLAASLNSANPVVLARSRCGPNMTTQAALVMKTLAAIFATVVGGASVLYAACGSAETVSKDSWRISSQGSVESGMGE